MTLSPDTPCAGCGRRIWLHRLHANRAWCAPRQSSPNLLAPEVQQARETLGLKVPYTLYTEARQVLRERSQQERADGLH